MDVPTTLSKDALIPRHLELIGQHGDVVVGNSYANSRVGSVGFASRIRSTIFLMGIGRSCSVTLFHLSTNTLPLLGPLNSMD